MDQGRRGVGALTPCRLQPAGLLGQHLEQATQLRAAYPYDAQDHGSDAAVAVPDIHAQLKGGAGETIRQKLLANYRPPHDRFACRPASSYAASGSKAKVIFFDNREASPDPWTKEVWYYDYRTNIHHTLKKKPMRFEDLAEFIGIL